MTIKKGIIGPLLSNLQPVVFTDLRIPLMWKDTEYFKNKGGEKSRVCVWRKSLMTYEWFILPVFINNKLLWKVALGCFRGCIWNPWNNGAGRREIHWDSRMKMTFYFSLPGENAYMDGLRCDIFSALYPFLHPRLQTVWQKSICTKLPFLTSSTQQEALCQMNSQQ